VLHYLCKLNYGRSGTWKLHLVLAKSDCLINMSYLPLYLHAIGELFVPPSLSLHLSPLSSPLLSSPLLSSPLLSPSPMEIEEKTKIK
jgi:hypothetical protein